MQLEPRMHEKLPGEGVEEDKARVDLGDGLRQYMAMADECLKELQSSESPFVAVLLQYD